MSFHIKDDFVAGGPISQVSASWFNAVGRFLNGLIGGRGMSVKRTPKGVVVELEPEKLRSVLTERTGENACSSTDDESKATVQSSFLAEDSWRPGQFTSVEGTTVDAASGVSFYVLTRAKKVIDTQYLIFRKATYNSNGALVHLSAEEFAVAVADESAL